MLRKGTFLFIIFAFVWEIAVALIYGLFFSYNETAFANMENVSTAYPFAAIAGNINYYQNDSTQFPFPLAVVAIAIILLIVGLAMIAGYIEGSAITGMAFTVLIFALTIQNFFIFRNFWNRISVNDSNAGINFSTPQQYSKINYINFGNDLQANYQLPSASFLDAVGAALAMYVGYTAVIGRIGLGEVFFLTWIGTFLYELNSQILWRMYIPDNGYPSRAFAYGGSLGLISSLVLNKRERTKDSHHYRSSYKVMALSFLGTILFWCSYPVLVLSSVYVSTVGKIIAMAGQVNIWLALSASVMGCFTASSFSYRKFCVHDMVFASITGAIAFSSSTDVNYNPGAAAAIGFVTGFLCSISQSRFKRKLNQFGVRDSNSAIFHFLLPSFFAAISSSVLQGVAQSASNTSIYTFTTTTSSVLTAVITQSQNMAIGRSSITQGGYQMIGWTISVCFGIVGGLIIGFLYKLLNDSFVRFDSFFNDTSVYEQGKGGQGSVSSRSEQELPPSQQQNRKIPQIRLSDEQRIEAMNKQKQQPHFSDKDSSERPDVIQILSPQRDQSEK